MAIEQLSEIQSLLRDWCSERNLDIQNQNANVQANLLEEVVEYLRAKDEYEKIDALCDIIVFSLNATDKEVELWSSEQIWKRNIRNIASMATYYIKDEIGCRILSKHQEREYLDKIINTAWYMISDMKYAPYHCLMETIKEISSRKGEYNETIKKFVKYQGAYNESEANEYVRNLDSNFEIIKEDKEYWYYGIGGAVQGQLVKWYRADYAKCKRFKT